MDAFEVPDWETFEQKVKELRAKYRIESSPLLFRGQGNSEWPITTTLERSGFPPMLFSEYYELICAGIGPELKTLFSFRMISDTRIECQNANSQGEAAWFGSAGRNWGRAELPSTGAVGLGGFLSSLWQCGAYLPSLRHQPADVLSLAASL